MSVMGYGGYRRGYLCSVREPVGSHMAGSNRRRAARVIAALCRSSSIRSRRRADRACSLSPWSDSPSCGCGLPKVNGLLQPASAPRPSRSFARAAAPARVRRGVRRGPRRHRLPRPRRARRRRRARRCRRAGRHRRPGSTRSRSPEPPVGRERARTMRLYWPGVYVRRGPSAASTRLAQLSMLRGVRFGAARAPPRARRAPSSYRASRRGR